MMNAELILAHLRYHFDQFPRDAVEAAVEIKDEIIPSLLDILYQAGINRSI